ncbi:MAG TPA: MlaD family protein [Gemmatimonadales bacterium]|jgi:phospholipid/cholesterol/gamma-HCH transport system substrate-binding protein|nr:MlaD family protein [Gemmatimonadales bacterium]
MDLRYSREVTVGVIVTVAIVVFILGTMWLSGRSVHSSNVVRIQFANVSGLKRASPVRVSGVNIGKVERIEFMDVGKVLVIVSLPPKIHPRVDADAKIVSVTLVGDYAIDLDPGSAPELLPPGKVILGSQDLGLSGRALELSDRADSILIGAQAIVNQKTAEQLRSTLTALEGTLKASERTMRIYSDTGQGPTAELTKTMAAFRQLSTRLDSTLANPALARTLSRTDTLTSNLAAMTAQMRSTGERLDTLLAAVNRGQGTLGKFATDSGLYYDMRDLSKSMKELLDELKAHPGKVPVTVKLF